MASMLPEAGGGIAELATQDPVGDLRPEAGSTALDDEVGGGGCALTYVLGLQGEVVAVPLWCDDIGGPGAVALMVLVDGPYKGWPKGDVVAP